MTSEAQGSYAPRPRPDVRLVEVGDESVLVDGWDLAVVLNATGALIWRQLDGRATVWDLAHRLAVEAGADPDEVARDVAGFVDRLGADGVLEGHVSLPPRDGGEPDSHDESDIEVVPMPPVGYGSVVTTLHGVDRSGDPVALIDPDGGHRLLVKWNPHCGYCAATVRPLHELRPALAAAGIGLVLVCIGDVDAMQRAAAAEARATGIDLPLVFAPDDDDPFPGAGTPSAYHVDGDGTVVSPTAHGAEDVPALAATLAGVELNQRTDDGGTVVRYLRRRGGMCPTDLTATPGCWTATRVYRIADHHVGIRVDTEATGAVLDRLFPGARVHDDRAGHSYSVSLPGAAAYGAAGPHRSTGSHTPAPSGVGSPSGARALNVFAATGGAVPLRSRNPGRVLAALLTQLDDDVLERALPTGSVRVMARAVVIDGEAVLLPVAVDGFAPRLQPVLADLGAALVDASRPVVDLTTGSLVVEPPLVDHDPTVVADLTADPGPGRPERPVVPAGRYPLRSWCVVRMGPLGVTGLTPAEAAAATVSTVFDTDDPAARVHQLGRLFAGGRTRGLALWYHDDPMFFATLQAAVTARAGLAEHR